MYTFDPAGFDKEEPFPVFGVDNVIIGVNEVLADALEGNAYLICGCEDYNKRERKYNCNYIRYCRF